MNRLHQLLSIQYNALHHKDWDNVLIVTGDEGTGKSNLVLQILEWWCKEKYNNIKNSDIDRLDLDISKWADGFAKCKKGDISILDEGGDISNKRVMSKLNYAISRAYQIIRGDNLNSIIVIPSIFDLDPFFTKRRAKGLIYVYKRGKFAFWSKTRLRNIVEINDKKPIKNVWRIRPTFYDNFPKYNGILLDLYNQKKKDYMRDTRKELAEIISEIKKGDSVSERNSLIIKMKENLGAVKTAEIVGLSERQIRRIYSENKDIGSNEV